MVDSPYSFSRGLNGIIFMFFVSLKVLILSPPSPWNLRLPLQIDSTGILGHEQQGVL